MTILVDSDHNVALVSRDIEKELKDYISNDLKNGIEIDICRRK